MDEHRDPAMPGSYTVVQLVLEFTSLDDARARQPQLLAEHLRNSRAMHENGELVMAGAFLEPGDRIETMAVLLSPDAARRFLDADPFVRAGFATEIRVRQWADMFFRRGDGYASGSPVSDSSIAPNRPDARTT